MWPQPNSRFTLEMDSFETDIPFQEASILDPEIETTDHRAGNGKHSNTGKVPGQMTTSTITLKNGIVPRNDSFHAWYTKIVVNKAKRETITIRLLDESGKSTTAWKLLNAWPAKITGPDLKSSGSKVLIETLETACEGLEFQAP